MHFASIRKGTTVVVRDQDGDHHAKAVRKVDGSWILDNGMSATPANLVKFLRGKTRPTSGPSSSDT